MEPTSVRARGGSTERPQGMLSSTVRRGAGTKCTPSTVGLRWFWGRATRQRVVSDFSTRFLYPVFCFCFYRVAQFFNMIQAKIYLLFVWQSSKILYCVITLKKCTTNDTLQIPETFELQFVEYCSLCFL